MFNTANKRQQTGFGTTQNTGFGFGQQAQSTPTTGTNGFNFNQTNQTSTPGTTGFGFGQTTQAPTSTLGGTFNFGTNNQAKPAGGLFGNSSQSTTQGTGLFGNTANTGTSLFGTNTNNNTNTGTGLFGNTANTGTSLFGSNTNNTNTSTGLFGNTTNTGTGLFGSNTNTNTGLFGNTNTGTGLFNSNTNTGFGFGQPQQQQFMGIQQTQQHTSTVADELRKIQEYWNPQSPNCQFKHYFYNMVHPSEVNRYVKPPNDDEGLWRQAQKNNPDPTCMVPAIAIGFEGVKKRIAEQSKQTNAHEEKLKELAGNIENLRQKHILETTGKLEEYRRRHLDLAHRTLRIMKQVYILRNRGYSIRPEEETLKVRLENLASNLRKSAQFRGRVEELWAHLQMIRDHPGSSWYNLASSTPSNINNNNTCIGSNINSNGNSSSNINKVSSNGKNGLVGSNCTSVNSNNNVNIGNGNSNYGGNETI